MVISDTCSYKTPMGVKWTIFYFKPRALNPQCWAQKLVQNLSKLQLCVMAYFGSSQDQLPYRTIHINLWKFSGLSFVLKWLPKKAILGPKVDPKYFKLSFQRYNWLRWLNGIKVGSNASKNLREGFEAFEITHLDQLLLWGLGWISPN